MEFFNLLGKAIPFFGQTFDVSLNWLGKLINGLITGVGVVGLGIIVFSLILKCIVLPFDVYQRIAMRKQNQKMKAQQERMEKLQKQYANDKEMYNRKLMEMYKENGISMFSSCLPMILSMVIFIVAINAFNAFSQYSNVQNYNTMVKAYNAQIERYCPDLESAEFSFVGEKIIVKGGAEDKDAYLYYEVNNVAYTSETEKSVLIDYVKSSHNKQCIVDLAKIEADDDFFAEIKKLIPEGTDVTVDSKEQAAYDYFLNDAQSAVLTAYNDTVSERTKFLWIKNIWVVDASYKKPVLSYTDFEAEAKREEFNVNGEKVSYGDISAKTGTQVYTSDAYELITAKLDVQKKQANGYFILIALSIGTILLQQFVMMRSQKEQQKFSSVDGQGASQQKMTMIMMTGMFAIFSFMYSSAFSIYMITSNIFSLISTLIINKIVDKRLEMQDAKAETIVETRASSKIEQAKQAGKASAQSTREKKSNKDAQNNKK